MNLKTITSTRWPLLLVACLILFAELLLLTQTVDAYGLIMYGVGEQSWLRAFGYFGMLAKWLVLVVGIVFVLLQKRLVRYLQLWHGGFLWRRCGIYSVLQVISFSCLF
ncbi:MAG TPA: hypothetical protein VIC26_01380, partial [Marinagarivorans sp.]